MEAKTRAPVLIRSVLFVPSIVERFVERAPRSGADVVCLDLEDSVPPDEKAKARLMAAEAIGSVAGTGYLTFARVNGLATGLLEDDLAAIVRPGLDGVMLPKADSAHAVLRVDHILTALERERGLEAGTVALMPLIETALGIVNSFQVCAASPRVAAVALGAEDLATDMGVRRTRGGEEIHWPRAQVAVAAHAAGVVPIDTPEADYADLAHLEEEALVARSLGYGGKLCIHPGQVPVANRVFSPTEEELTEARTIVEHFEREGIAGGRAAISIEGKMVDTPMYERARRLLALADAASRAAAD